MYAHNYVQSLPLCINMLTVLNLLFLHLHMQFKIMLHLLIQKSFFYKYLNGRGESSLNLFILIKCLRVDW